MANTLDLQIFKNSSPVGTAESWIKNVSLISQVTHHIYFFTFIFFSIYIFFSTKSRKFSFLNLHMLFLLLNTLYSYKYKRNSKKSVNKVAKSHRERYERICLCTFIYVSEAQAWILHHCLSQVVNTSILYKCLPQVVNNKIL